MGRLPSRDSWLAVDYYPNRDYTRWSLALASSTPQ